jgi:hypothetical protein
MTAVSFPAGFTPADFTLDALNLTRPSISSGRPARPLGQPHHRDQTCERHQVLVVEDRCGPRPPIR